MPAYGEYPGKGQAEDCIVFFGPKFFFFNFFFITIIIIKRKNKEVAVAECVC